jgi:hypothetical protein
MRGGNHYDNDIEPYVLVFRFLPHVAGVKVKVVVVADLPPRNLTGF